MHLISPLWIIYKVRFSLIFCGTHWQPIANLRAVSQPMGNMENFAPSKKSVCYYFFFFRITQLH